ncbi:MAG: hypothetical protein JJU36_04375, partial [Phycisphaeraceae bacterium]|nr:hypothetical protein [Phycisphaeraceae bacterium]
MIRRLPRTIRAFLPALAVAAACGTASAQTAWTGPGDDATDLNNWSNGVPGGPTALDTNANSAYQIDLNGVTITGGGTTVSSEDYTIINSGAAANWTGQFTINADASVDVTNVALTGPLLIRGELTVNDQLALGSHTGVELDGGTLRVEDDVLVTVGFNIGRHFQTTANGGVIDIASDKTMQVTGTGTQAWFVAGRFPVPPRDPADIFIRGGTFERLGDVIMAGGIDAPATGRFILENGATFKSVFQANMLMHQRMIHVTDGTRIELTGTGANEVNSTIGTLYAGGTISVTDGVARAWASDAFSIQFADLNSSLSNPHILHVADGALLGVGSNQTQGGLLGAWDPNVDFEDREFPVVYVRKTGEGVFAATRGREGVQLEGQPLKVFWDVAEGTLSSTRGLDGASNLGATATQRNFVAPLTGIKSMHLSHLDGIIVRDGATLEWAGTQGFFDDSWWITEHPNAPADGWQPGDFVLEGGSTLVGGRLSGGGLSLNLGFFDATDGTFLAYPTVGDASTGGAVEFGRNINFRSGIEVGAGVPGGLLDVTVTGGTWVQSGVPNVSRVRFTGDLDGALPVDVFQSLDVQSGRAGIYQSHANVQTTTIGVDGGVYFDPGSSTSIAYSGTIANEGVVEA